MQGDVRDKDYAGYPINKIEMQKLWGQKFRFSKMMPGK